MGSGSDQLNLSKYFNRRISVLDLNSRHTNEVLSSAVRFRRRIGANHQKKTSSTVHSPPLSLSVTMITLPPRLVNKAKVVGLFSVDMSSFEIPTTQLMRHPSSIRKKNVAALPVLGEEKCLIITIFTIVWSVYTYKD